MSSHADVGQRVGLAVVDALAELHLVDPDAVGLGDLGRPDGFVQRQVAGWTKRWELAAPPDAEPLMPVIGERLAAAIPSSPRPAILHNDYKLDNCQFDPSDPDRVKSIFDWDMATLGDPFVDLGTLLNYWPDPSDTDEDRAIHNPGMESLGLPDSRRGGRALRGGHRLRRRRRLLVRGVRLLEDGGRAATALHPLRARGEHRREDGDARREDQPAGAPGDDDPRARPLTAATSECWSVCEC